MREITVSVSESVHRRARMRAAVVRDFLIAFSRAETDFQRRKRLERTTIESIGRFDAADRQSRDRVHDRFGRASSEEHEGGERERHDARVVDGHRVVLSDQQTERGVVDGLIHE